LGMNGSDKIVRTRRDTRAIHNYAKLHEEGRTISSEEVDILFAKENITTMSGQENEINDSLVVEEGMREEGASGNTDGILDMVDDTKNESVSPVDRTVSVSLESKTPRGKAHKKTAGTRQKMAAKMQGIDQDEEDLLNDTIERLEKEVLLAEKRNKVRELKEKLEKLSNLGKPQMDKVKAIEVNRTFQSQGTFAEHAQMADMQRGFPIPGTKPHVAQVQKNDSSVTPGLPTLT
jgi:hypothetical protein